MHRYHVSKTAHSFWSQGHFQAIFDSATQPKGQLIKVLEGVSKTNNMLEEAKFAVFVE